MKTIFGILLFVSIMANAANEYKQPNPAIFYNTVKLPQLSTSGIVTNTSAGQLGSASKVPVANGGTNSSNALLNNKIVVSSGGTIGESTTASSQLLFLDATSSIQTQLNGKQPTIALPITVANGGTNSVTALLNNKFVVSSGGTIGEYTPINGSLALATNSLGLPTGSTTTSAELAFVSGVTSAIQTQINTKQATIVTLPVANGGTASAKALLNNRFIVSSGSTIGEAVSVTPRRVVFSDANGLPTATNSLLNNNRIIISSGGTLAEIASGASGQVLTSNGTSSPSWNVASGASVVTPSAGQEQMIRIQVGTDGAPCTSGTCTINSQTANAVTSVVWNSTGNYTINFAPGTFTAGPICVANDATSASSYHCKAEGDPSTSLTHVGCYTTVGGSIANVNWVMICMGAH
jgi:hypothetical protein